MQPQNTINVPAFLSKLWKMVNDPTTDRLICWNQNGSSFVIQNQAQFWYDLLPVYYKHNNMSSFVRQLNMYGFHKMSVVDNGAEANKDEIQFFHPCFQQGKPELLKNIKRKVTPKSAPGSGDSPQSMISQDDFVKVLTDVRNLNRKQKNVDSQLMAMKQENAILWRELALLRQKHLKQQQIVNKLIQFLVTIVQPSSRMGGLGVKRHFPLMINESPKKMMKPNTPPSTTSEGPIIHELDSADILSEELLADTDSIIEEEINSNVDPNAENTTEILFDHPEMIDKEAVNRFLADNDINDDSTANSENDKVFLNPSTQDTLLSNLMNGSYNSKTLKDLRDTGGRKENECLLNNTDDMAVVTRDVKRSLSRLNSVDDMGNHIESTQNELDQLKDLLNGYSTLDANTLLGKVEFSPYMKKLFNGESPEYGLSCNQESTSKNADPLVSGSELATYNSGIDFSQLFDDSSEEQLQSSLLQAGNLDSEGSITTPQLLADAPLFPATELSKNEKSLGFLFPQDFGMPIENNYKL